MKTSFSPAVILLATFSASLFAAQDGSLQFVARVTPVSGIEEPVRGFPFYLLRKSFEDISKEADAAFPKPDMDGFIDKLDVSKELKAWMKKNQRVSLAGEDFIHKLHPADILAVPEFYEAYVERNSGDQSTRFPKPKFKPSDKVKDPDKYQKLLDQYRQAILHFAEQNPETIDGIDLNLSEIDPGHTWQLLEGKREPAVHRRVMELAESTYLVARTETDLEGAGVLRGIAPGTYWLSTLDVSANIGDARPRWDIPLTIRAGDTTHVALSVANAIRPPDPGPVTVP